MAGPAVGRRPVGRPVPRPAWRRRRRVTAAGGSIALAALLIGVVLVSELPGSSRGASPTRTGAGASAVQYRNLVATDTESGTLSYANPHTVFNRVSGTITALPKIGQVIKPGQTLYEVSGNPVTLFDGAVPAYRDLSSGDSAGADILELNRNLRALGFDPGHAIALNNTWQAATTTAVALWQGSVGEAQTGTVTLGQIVFLPGVQRVTTVEAVLGSTGGGASSAASGSSASSAAHHSSPAPRPEFVSLTTTAAPAARSATAACPPAGMVQPGGTSGATTNPQTTTAPTTTGPATPAPTATTPPPGGSCSGSGGSKSGSASKSGSRTPSRQAVLLALLKAETQELKKSLSDSGASPSAGGSGASRGSGSTSSSSSGRSASVGGSTGSSGGASSSASSSGGSGGATTSAGATAQALLQTTSNQPVVTVNLDATKQREAVVGAPVTVQLPSGDTVGGEIIDVSPVAQASSSSSSSSSGSGSGSGSGATSSAPAATIPVTIKLTGHHRLSGLDQAAVSVNFQQQVENHVLSVPVTALLATAGGGYAVQQAAAPHRLIAVTAGLFAAGYVQISGAQVHPGLQVTDSQG